eukprot:3549308-Prymnesium_polylepis.1
MAPSIPRTSLRLSYQCAGELIRRRRRRGRRLRGSRRPDRAHPGVVLRRLLLVSFCDTVNTAAQATTLPRVRSCRFLAGDPPDFFRPPAPRRPMRAPNHVARAATCCRGSTLGRTATRGACHRGTRLASRIGSRMFRRAAPRVAVGGAGGNAT